MAQKQYIAKITPSVGGSPIDVQVPANDPFQARKMIEAQYGPVKSWWDGPREAR